MIQNEKEYDGEVPDLIPARMLNEFTYCPRLCYIEWVQGEFVDSADTVDGRFQHRRVDAKPDKLPDEQETFHARSVYLTGPDMGITCRIDLLEGEGNQVTPIDYKRGKAPKIPEGAYEPERVQLCAQGLVLRENDFDCTEGVIYYVRSKQRVTIPFDDDLVDRTKELIAALGEMARGGEMPPPLEYSPKCVRCSLVGICLPDEVNILRETEKEGAEPPGRVRRLLPARDDEIPVYVVGQGQTIRKRGDRLEVWSREEGKVSDAKLREVSQLALYGGVGITTPALVELLQRGIPVCYFTHGGWFYGISQGTSHKNVELRMRQFQCAGEKMRSLELARMFVSGKIRNCRTLIRRNDSLAPKEILGNMGSLIREAEEARSAESLLGI